MVSREVWVVRCLNPGKKSDAGSFWSDWLKPPTSRGSTELAEAIAPIPRVAAFLRRSRRALSGMTWSLPHVPKYTFICVDARPDPHFSRDSMTDMSGWAKNHRVSLPGYAILLNGVLQSTRRGGEIGVPGFQPIRRDLRFIRFQRNDRLFLGRLGRLLVEFEEAGIVFADVLHNFPIRP